MKALVLLAALAQGATPERWVELPELPAARGETFVSDFAVGPDGIPWVMGNGRVLHFDGRTYRELAGFRSGTYLAGLHGGGDRPLYLTTYQGMLYRVSGPKASYLADFDYDVPHERPGIFVDRQGRVFNYGRAFAQILEKDGWRRVETTTSEVLPIALEGNDRVGFYADGRVTRYHEGRWSADLEIPDLKIETSEPGRRLVKGALLGGETALLLKYGGQKLYAFNLRTLEVTDLAGASKRLEGSRLYDLFRDRRGHVWVFNRRDGKYLYSELSPEPLAVASHAETAGKFGDKHNHWHYQNPEGSVLDHRGDTWLGHVGAGLVRIANGKLERVEVPVRRARWLVESGKRLWAADPKGSVVCLDRSGKVPKAPELVALETAPPTEEPGPDEIASRFPDPCPADRAWEMADAYSKRIGSSIAAGQKGRAHLWLQSARSRLKEPYLEILNGAVSQWVYRAWNRKDQSVYATRNRAETCLKLGAADGAVPVLERLITLDPGEKSIRHRLDLVWCHAAGGRLEKARETLDAVEALAKGESWGSTIERHRKWLRTMGDDMEVAERVRVFTEWTTSHRKPPFPVLRLTRAALDGLKEEKARARLLQAGSMILHELKDHTGAAAWEEKVLTRAEQDPETAASILLRRGNAAYEKKAYAEAEKAYRRLVSDHPNSRQFGAALFNLGLTLKDQSKYAQARGIFGQLLLSPVNDHDPTGNIMSPFRNYRPRAAVEIGRCYEAEEKWREALEAYETALTKYPTVSFCGTCRRHSEEKERARIERCRKKLK